VDRARTASYKLTSTVILHLSSKAESLGDLNLSGNMTRQVEQVMPVEDDSSHIANVGKVRVYSVVDTNDHADSKLAG
jgi:capping protein beta